MHVPRSLRVGTRILRLLALGVALGSAAPAQAVTIVLDIAAGAAIPHCCGSVTFTFPVAVAGTIADVDVRFAASHTFVNDLAVWLEAPDGAQVPLFDGIAVFNNRFQDTYFDQDTGACTLGKSGCITPPFAGPEYAGGRTYRPEYDTLDGFDGRSAAGNWLLRVNDAFSGDAGYVYAAGQAAPWGAAIGTQLILTIVPEPSTLLLVGAGAALLAARRRRAA